jgi:hypothetical protein
MPLGRSHQSRVAANISSAECHMCTLLGTSIPRLLKPFDPLEALVWRISGAQHDRDAVKLGLVGTARKVPGKRVAYSNLIWIQNGEK